MVRILLGGDAYLAGSGITCDSCSAVNLEANGSEHSFSKHPTVLIINSTGDRASHVWSGESNLAYMTILFT